MFFILSNPLYIKFFFFFFLSDIKMFSSVLFSCSVMSDSLPHLLSIFSYLAYLSFYALLFSNFFLDVFLLNILWIDILLFYKIWNFLSLLRKLYPFVIYFDYWWFFLPSCCVRFIHFQNFPLISSSYLVSAIFMLSSSKTLVACRPNLSCFLFCK